MREPTLDPERLAALLDGGLDERAREELLEELALSRDDLEILAEAAAVSRELEEEDAAAGDAGDDEPSARVVPITSAPSRRPPIAPPRRWLAIAAVVAGLALVPVLWRAMAGPRAGSPVAALSAPAAGLPAGWDGSPWDATRSPGASLPEEVRAVRIGALLADLELALRAGGPEAPGAAARAAALLEQTPGAGSLAAGVEALGRDGAAAGWEDRLAELRAQVRETVPPEWWALGEWAETARVAAAREDAAFFRTGAFTDGLDAAAETVGQGPAAAELERVRLALRAEGEPDWAGLREALRALLSVAGG